MASSITQSNYTSVPSQAKRLQERRDARADEAVICGERFLTLPGVYDTSGDTELMAETVELKQTDSFLEVGCGSGAVCILLAKKCASGVATDINRKAIENTKLNAERFGVKNLRILHGDCFAGIDEKFDALICNPPYGDHPVSDEVDRMFWDPDNELKRLFFKGAKEHLLPDGRIYFGWADFADIDTKLPFRLAAENGLTHVKTSLKPRKNKYHFIVLEFRVSM